MPLVNVEDPRAEIERLEAEIEELADVAERCRKIALAAKFAILAGGAWIALILLDVIAAGGLSLLVVIILLIGGTVLLGSNSGTAKQTAARIDAAEKLRAELIGSIELHDVPEPRPLLH